MTATLHALVCLPFAFSVQMHVRLGKNLTSISARLQNPFPPNAPSMATIQLGFLPLNHLMGRMTLLKCLITGGQVCFGQFSCFAFSPGYAQQSYAGHMKSNQPT